MGVYIIIFNNNISEKFQNLKSFHNFTSPCRKLIMPWYLKPSWFYVDFFIEKMSFSKHIEHILWW